MGFEIPIIILASSLSAYTDWKTGEIPDWITYPTILLGIILSILSFQFIGLLFGLLIYLFGIYLQYEVGGGDVKLLIGMSTLLPYYHGNIFALNVLFIACILGILWVFTSKIFDKDFELKSNHRFAVFILLGTILSLAGVSVFLKA